MTTPPRRLEAVGYWFNDLAPSGYPRPQRLVGAWRPEPQAIVLAHLRSGVVFESYRGRSFCRFSCGAPPKAMGHRDLTDGVWVWPEGLAHYVEVHSVRLPERFIAHAIAHPDASTARVPEAREGLIDEASWLAWGKQQGASLELAGWQVPDWAAQQALVRQLAEATRPGDPWAGQEIAVVLASARTVVCLLPSGKIAIVARARDAPTRILASWEEWSDAVD